MGTWGPGLYSDDTALDVRDQYKELVRDGIAPEEATNNLMEEYLTGDIPEDTVFWLALADTQWKWGQLETRVKQKALDIIQDGIDLARWHEEAFNQNVHSRKKVLDQLRSRLESSQPPPKKLPKPYVNTCQWKIGEVISYCLVSGKFVLFHVIGHDTSYGGIVPVMQLLDWLGEILPAPEQIARLELMRPTNPLDPKLHVIRQEEFDKLKVDGVIPEDAVFEDVRRQILSEIPQLVIYRKTSRELPSQRCNLVSRELTSNVQVNPLAMIGVRWQYLDHLLLNYFSLK